MTKEERLEKENAALKERIVFLENGLFVIERAAEYKARFDAYAAQVERLERGLQQARKLLYEQAKAVSNGKAATKAAWGLE